MASLIAGSVTSRPRSTRGGGSGVGTDSASTRRLYAIRTCPVSRVTTGGGATVVRGPPLRGLEMGRAHEEDPCHARGRGGPVRGPGRSRRASGHPGHPSRHPDVAQARLLEASAERERNLARVDALLVSPEGGEALKRVGVSEGPRARRAPHLDRRRAARPGRARGRPPGRSHGRGLTTKQWIWIIAAVVAIVVIIIVAS